MQEYWAFGRVNSPICWLHVNISWHMVYHSPKCPRTQFSILPYAKGPNFQFSQMIFDRMTALLVGGAPYGQRSFGRVYKMGIWESSCTIWAYGRTSFEPILMVYQMLVVLGIWESQFSHMLELCFMNWHDLAYGRVN